MQSKHGHGIAECRTTLRAKPTMTTVSESLKPRAQSIAQHEMGHYVVATVLGFRTGDVCIALLRHNGHRGGAGIDLAQSLASTADVSLYLRRRVQVLYAGAAGEALTANNIVNQERALKILETRTAGADQDHAKARELVHILRSIEFAQSDANDSLAVQGQLDALSDELWQATIVLVEEHSRAICGLAGNLVDRAMGAASTVANMAAALTEAELGALAGVQALPRATWP